MKALHASITLALGSVMAALAQGPLDPVSGPTPTMKSLDQIEPRTPITSLPFTITEPGSYFVTDNLSVSNNDGIVVEADNVAIDLRGHTLTGNGTGRGITVTHVDGVSIRNGSIVNFADGIALLNSSYGQFENLVLAEHANRGISAQGLGGRADGHHIRAVTARGNADVGIALVSDSGGSASGNIITDVRLIDNGVNGFGILARNGEVSGNIIRNGLIQGTESFSGLDILSQTGGTSAGNIVENMQVRDNAHSGIRLMAFDSTAITTGNLIRNNQIIGNGDQIPALSVQGMNGGQANGNLLENNEVRDNASFGIYLNTSVGGTARGNVIRGSTVSGNSSFGIRLDGDTAGTRVENNLVSDHPTGIAVGTSKSFVFKNTLFNNGTAITAGAGNIVAPVNTGSGEISNIVNAWSNFAP